MLLYDDISDLTDKKILIDVRNPNYDISELGYERNGYIGFYSEKTVGRGVINTEGKLIIEPKYSGFTDFSGDYAVFYDNKTGQGKYGLMSLSTGKIIVEPKFLSISINDGRFFGEIEYSRKQDNFSISRRKEIDIDGLTISKEYETLAKCLSDNNIAYPRKNVCYWGDDYLGIYDDGNDSTEDMFHIPHSELAKGGVTEGLCDPTFTQLDNGLILLYFEENQLIIGLNSEGKRLFSSNTDEFYKKFGINDKQCYDIKYSNGKILFLNEGDNQLNVITITDFIKEIKDIGKGFYTVGNNKYYGNPGDKLKDVTNTSELSEILSLCEETQNNIEINGKKFSKKLLKLK